LAGHELVAEVRYGTGFLVANQLDVAAQPELPAGVLAGLRRADARRRALQVSPSFVSTDADLKALKTAVADVLDGRD
jgi:hypothetical protein